MVLTLCLLLFLAGCGSTDTGEEPVSASEAPAAATADAPDEDLLTDVWLLEAFGEIGEEQPRLDESEITLQFDRDGHVSGSGGCNRYSTTFKTGPSGEITFHAMALTKMACPEEIMAQEDAYLAALASATSYDVGAGQLQLFYGEELDQVLVFGGEPREESAPAD
jgi:heat shock protein HslJ